MRPKTLQDISLKDKKVVVRVDFNVPVTQNGEISDDSRIRAALPTIRFILGAGGSVILLSHFGRPCGVRVESMSLAVVAKHLAKLLKQPIHFCPDCIGEIAEKMAGRLEVGEVLLLENLRFYPQEESGSESGDFVTRLARLGDVYVNDAFSVSHRKHASTYYLPQKFQEAVIGFLTEKEILILTNLLTQAKRPFYAVIGGSKVSSKIGVLETLLPNVDGIFIGGGMAFTFLKAKGFSIGNSLLDETHLETAKQIIKRCKSKGVELFLPIDTVITQKIAPDQETNIVGVEEGIPEGWIGVDIGPKTIELWRPLMNQAKTIFWNGPVGVFEIPPFDRGTCDMAKLLADSKAMTIIGGGDSAAAVYRTGLDQKMTCISTGGGATLEFIEHGTLPALEVLSKKP